MKRIPLTELIHAWLASLLVLAVLASGPILAANSAEPGGQETPETRRILIITGEDYHGHRWQETGPVLQEELARHPQLLVELLTDLSEMADTPLSDYDAVVLHFKNYDPQVPGRSAFDNLVEYVRGGGGLMLVHFACGAFEEFKAEYLELAGRVWFGATPPPGMRQHDPHGRFTVNITDVPHPITRDLEDFEIVDELYTCLEGDLPITVLATAVSKVDGQTYPMAFVHHFGEGRVFHSVLGHDVVAFRNPGAAELHRRGAAWVAQAEP